MRIVELCLWSARAGEQEALYQALGALADNLKEKISDIDLFVILQGSSTNDPIRSLQSFKTQAAKDSYDGLDLVRELDELSTKKNILAGPPRRRNLKEIAGYSCRRRFSGSPISIFASLTYKPSKRESSYADWRKIAQSVEQEEEDVLSYWILEDTEDPDVLHAFERFADLEARQAHVQSSFVTEIVQKQKDIRVNTTARSLQEHPSSILCSFP